MSNCLPPAWLSLIPGQARHTACRLPGLPPGGGRCLRNHCLMQGTKISDRIKLNQNGLSELARSVALPKENPARRLPTFPYVARTAVVSLEHTGTAETSLSKVLRASLTRFPSAPLWLSQDFPDRRATFLNDSLFYAYSKPATNRTFSIFGASSPAAFVSYGGLDYCLYPQGAAVYAQAWGTAGLIEATALIFSDEDPGAFTLKPFDFNTTLNQWDPVSLPAGTVGVHVTRTGINATDVWLHFFGSNLLWPVRVPVLDDIPFVYSDTRCTAAAVLFSNVTRVLEKEGTVRGARLIAGTPYQNAVPAWPGAWQSLDLNDIHPSEKYFGAMENGVYTYTLHTPESELFQDAVFRTILLGGPPPNPTTANGYLQAPRLNAITGAFSALEFVDVDATSATTLAYTLNFHLEFRTTSPVFEIGFSAVPIEAYHSATVALAATPVFFENPVHWRSLVSLIARGLSLAIPLVAPQYSAAARAIGVAGSLIAPTKRPTVNMQQKQMAAPASKRAPRRRRARSRARPKQPVRRS